MTLSSPEPRAHARPHHGAAHTGVSSFAARGWTVRRPAALPLMPMTQARVRPDRPGIRPRAVVAAALLGGLLVWISMHVRGKP